MSEPEESRIIYVQVKGRNQAVWYKLHIPATAKVTFGPLIPGGGGMQDRSGGLYLRVYKTKDHQLAVFPNVIQFRDADLMFEEPTSTGFTEVSEIELLGSMAERELAGERGE